MRIGYGKLARSWNLDTTKASTVGGDIDVVRLLRRLSKALPDDELFLLGRCKGGSPKAHGFDENVFNPWHEWNWDLPPVIHKPNMAPEDYTKPRDLFRELTGDLNLDAVVLWLGQVANANSPIPPSGEDWDNCKLTNPQVMAVNYTLYLLDFLNRKGIEPILLCPDPRNYWKPRELTRPFTQSILAQYDTVRGTRHEQFDKWGLPWQDGWRREGSQLVAAADYDYAGVELTALDEPDLIDFDEIYERPHLIGIISNENKTAVHDDTSRRLQVKKYILDKWPDAPIYGTWTDETQEFFNRKIEPIPYTEMYSRLQQFKCSVTFPASGSGWATAKAWEAFAVGTVMFFHHKYDDQGHIVSRSGKKWRQLRKFLIVHNQRQLWQRVKMLEDDPGLWHNIICQQRQLFEEHFDWYMGGAARVIDRIEEKRK